MSLPRIVIPEDLSPEKREEGLRIIAKIREAHEQNPFLFWKPHAKQVDFLRAKPPKDVTLFVRGFLGGNQSGKTTCGLADDLIQACDREALPEHLLPYKRFEPPFKCRIFTPDLTKTGKGSLYEKLKELIPKDQLIKGSWDKSFDKDGRKLNFSNGSWFDFLSYEQDEDKFGGITLDRVHFDEEPPGEKGRRIYNQARMRVMARKGDIIFTMTPELGMCVDVTTQALTKRGWKYHDELELGEPILTYNQEAGVTEWAPLTGLYRDENYSGPMRHAAGHLDAMFTPDHKWVTPRGLVPWTGLKKTDRAVVTAPHRNVNVDQLSLEVLELVGWVLSEGCVLKNENKVVIYQSESRYPQHCRRIEELLEATGAQYHQADRSYDVGGTATGTIRRFVMTGEMARIMRWLVGYPKKLRPEFVGSLSQEGLEALLKGLVDGDGHVKDTGSWHLTTCERDLADSVQIVAVLCGWRAALRHFQQRGKTVWRVTAGRRSTISEFKRRADAVPPPFGGVWCPNTPNGTWVARRDGSAFITGNSWMFDEIFERRLDPDVHITQVATDENTFLDGEAVDQAFASMTDEEQDAKRKGRFVAFGGLVVQVEKDKHVIQRPDPSHVRGLENYVVIDPGAAQGAVLFGGFDREDSLLVWDELYPSGHPQTIVSNVVAQIHEKLADWGVRKRDVIFVVDPSARNRTVDGGAGVEQAYWEQGIFPIHGKNNRRASVMQLRRRAGADQRLLLISEECRKLLWELGRWRVAEDETSDRVKRDQTGDSFATAGPDHLADCLRYMAMERIFGPVMQEGRSAFHGWVPDQAPPQEWFQQRVGTSSAPMGHYS